MTEETDKVLRALLSFTLLFAILLAPATLILAYRAAL